MLSDTADLCATCGTQALDLHFSSKGGTAQFWEYYDANPNEDIFVLMNGSYQVSFWAKAGSGVRNCEHTPSVAAVAASTAARIIQILRMSGSSIAMIASPLNPPPVQAPQVTPLVWRSPATRLQGPADIYLDNVSFKKISPLDATNNTLFRDEIVRSFRDLYPSPCSAPGTIRYWVDQNSETIDNWTRPDYARNPTGSGFAISPGGQNSYQLSLEDFLVLVENIQTTTGCPIYPYISVPVTLLNGDAANLVEFLARLPRQNPPSTANGG